MGTLKALEMGFFFHRGPILRYLEGGFIYWGY